MDTTILVCSECGGDNIQVRAWVNANSNTFVGQGEGEIKDNWCNNCLKHVGFESEAEYEMNHPEELDSGEETATIYAHNLAVRLLSEQLNKHPYGKLKKEAIETLIHELK